MLALLSGVAATRPAEASCHEQSESSAVGVATCHRFGAWDAGRAVRLGAELSLGLNVHRIDVSGRGLSLCGSGSNCPFVRYGDVDKTVWSGLSGTVTTGSVRATFVNIYVLHLGIHFEMGGGSGPGQIRGPGAVGGDTSFLYSTYGLFLGGRTSLGHFVLGADLVTGKNELSVGTGWLKIRGVGTPQGDSLFTSRFALQADVSLVYYLRPSIALGIRAGAETLHAPEDYFAGAILRFSYDPYEGTRTR